MEICKLQDQISLHRSYLMGIAILWIMIHHIQFFGLYDFSFLSFFARIGSCGVDIFLFVSSFGLYHSLIKNGRIKDFYKRRFFRIFPTFIVFLLIIAVLRDPVLIFSPRYWYGQFYSNWYISFILIMYLIYPFIFRVQQIHLYLPLILGLTFSLLMTTLLVLLGKDDIHDVPMLMLQRVPIFVAGSLFADKRFMASIPFGVYLLNLVVTCVVLYYSYQYGFEYLVYPIFFFLTISLVVLFLSFWVKMIDKPLSICGSISLELYLIHMVLIPFVMRHHIAENNQKWIIVLMVFVISFVTAVLLKRFVSIVIPSVQKM